MKKRGPVEQWKIYCRAPGRCKGNPYGAGTDTNAMTPSCERGAGALPATFAVLSATSPFPGDHGAEAGW
jgi:hypothetical protein